ncbi:Oxoglutarate/iron-dependent dioxygenase [Macleaya cordata]|uniref:Oxoglutarate/iron-dependent dioxygenase n=1 Tax=Macleaya cordata TaxID=56857 RepID=A0A200PNA5_MACCD|nr:Oxoglutarate/iron-dependent dioxygenase [Macleaya cordata]
MSPKTLNKLPIIDFTRDKLNPGTNNWFLVRTKVRRALEEYGCFEAVYDSKVPLKLHNEMFDAVKELFDLPLKTKIQNTSDKPYYGYDGQTSVRPLLEGMGIDDAPVLEQVQSFTNLMWPEGNDNFCEIVHSFAKRVTELEQMVTRMVFESYGVEKYYNSHIESMNYLLRVLKYRSPLWYETKLGATPHTDKSFITILHQNHVNGLEVQTKNGEWIKVTPSASSFIVMLGDAFLAWSNGRLRSPHHRVVMKGDDDTRYSIGLFGFSRKLVEVPKELVDEEHPLQFKPFCQMGLIKFLATEEGQKAESTVKAYCGI